MAIDSQQMKRKNYAKIIFMMISNWKKTFGLYDLYKNISALKGFNMW